MDNPSVELYQSFTNLILMDKILDVQRKADHEAMISPSGGLHYYIPAEDRNDIIELIKQAVVLRTDLLNIGKRCKETDRKLLQACHSMKYIVVGISLD